MRVVEGSVHPQSHLGQCNEPFHPWWEEPSQDLRGWGSTSQDVSLLPPRRDTK